MIGVDTNILVRIFAADDGRQAASAIRRIDNGAPGQIFVNVVVLAEFAWTMRRADKGRILCPLPAREERAPTAPPCSPACSLPYRSLM
jgi:predicted nucleic acid-binding protein